ncbi:MAG: hypothetical protein EBQ89_11250 [Alphaproteobacteria bacterium]|nr:hypothetical protein [Alphaproteobacteria bacterium]
MIRVAMGTPSWYDEPAESLTELSGSKVSRSGDTMTGALHMSGNLITGLPETRYYVQEGEEILYTSAVNKQYVDDITAPGRSHFVWGGKAYATVTTPVAAGEDLVFGVNTDQSLPPLWTGLDAVNIFMNGQLLRHSYSYSENDVDRGSLPNSIRLTFNAVPGDVICIEQYLIPDVPPGLLRPADYTGGNVLEAYYFADPDNQTYTYIRLISSEPSLGDELKFDGGTYTVTSIWNSYGVNYAVVNNMEPFPGKYDVSNDIVWSSGGQQLRVDDYRMGLPDGSNMGTRYIQLGNNFGIGSIYGFSAGFTNIVFGNDSLTMTSAVSVTDGTSGKVYTYYALDGSFATAPNATDPGGFPLGDTVTVYTPF